jgi:predicted small secreted protein
MIQVMKQDALRVLTALLFLSAMILALPACNTVEGAGEDIQATGDAISDTADDAEDELSD